MGFRSFFGWFGWDFKSFNGIYFMVRFGYYNRINSLDASKNGYIIRGNLFGVKFEGHRNHCTTRLRVKCLFLGMTISPSCETAI